MIWLKKKRGCIWSTYYRRAIKMKPTQFRYGDARLYIQIYEMVETDSHIRENCKYFFITKGCYTIGNIFYKDVSLIIEVLKSYKFIRNRLILKILEVSSLWQEMAPLNHQSDKKHCTESSSPAYKHHSTFFLIVVFHVQCLMCKCFIATEHRYVILLHISGV